MKAIGVAVGLAVGLLSLYGPVPSGAGAADPGPPKPAELKVLDRLVGSWQEESISKPAEWTPKEERTKATITTEWVLGGWFVQVKERSDDNQEAIHMITYDVERKAYRRWRFNSTGGAGEATGKWDEDSKTFTWTRTLEKDITLVSRWKLVDKDTMEETAIAKDKNGKVYLDVTGKTTRRK